MDQQARRAAALAAVVVFAGTGSPGCGSSRAGRSVTASSLAAPPAAPVTTAAPVATTAVAPPRTVQPVPTTIPAATPSTNPGPVGGPVPAGFQANSATFVSDTAAWVLGTAPCPSPPCTSILRTRDRGTSWVGLPTPRDALVRPGGGATGAPAGPASGVSEIRFAGPLDGWVFGPDLWATHDGGATWAKLTVGGPGATVEALAASGGQVFAVVAPQCASQGQCAAGLYRSPVSSDGFSAVSSVVLPSGVSGEAAVALYGAGGWVVGNPPAATGGGPATQPAPVWHSADGSTWAKVPTPCPATLTAGDAAPISSREAFVFCSGEGAAGSTQKVIYRTTDAGAGFAALSGAVPRSGDGGTLAAARDSVIGVATASGASEVYLSVDRGASWTTPLQFDDGGVGWGDFGFTDATHGLIVHAPAAALAATASGGPQNVPDPGTLLLTSNGGAAWTPVKF